MKVFARDNCIFGTVIVLQLGFTQPCDPAFKNVHQKIIETHVVKQLWYFTTQCLFFRQLAHVIKQQFRGLVVCYPMFLAWFDAFISCFSPPVRNVFWMPRLFQSQKNLNKTVSLSQKVLLAPHACFTSIGFQAMLHGSFHLQNTTVGTGGFQAPFININCLQWNLKDCWSYSASILPSSCSWLPAWPQSGPLGAEFAQVLSQKGVH